MLGLTNVFKAQSKFGISSTISNNEQVTYAVYLAGCRRMLTDKTPKDYYSWERRRQNDYTDNLIISYVRNNIKDVEGFLDDNGDILAPVFFNLNILLHSSRYDDEKINNISPS